MQPATLDLTILKPNPRNPRTISDAAFAKICESIQRDPEFMALRPIVVDSDNLILGGNQRYRACRHLSMTSVPAAWVNGKAQTETCGAACACACLRFQTRRETKPLRRLARL